MSKIMIAVEEESIIQIENLVAEALELELSSRLRANLDTVKRIINDMMVGSRNATQWCREQDEKDKSTTLELARQYSGLPTTQKLVFNAAILRKED